MELKQYQQQVIDDLQDYLNLLIAPHSGSLNMVFQTFWQQNQRYPIEKIEPYQDMISGVPSVCVKVPTAGGKTFIAVNALLPIFNAVAFFQPQRPRLVLWLVPSESILSQTLKNLRDIHHPYRQKLNAHFGGASRVQVFDKEQVLMGQGFNADSVKSGISIVVMSFDSLKGRSKEVLRAYRDNSNLASFRQPEQADDDEISLVSVLNSLNPVLIVDESHHTNTPLSQDMLKNLNPCFILELTATPKKSSNIISFVSSLALKSEQMVKLPLIVSRQRGERDVIMSALTLRNNLEKIAVYSQKTHNAPYIRPIVLFQAEPKNKEDNATFEHIKKQLLHAGIPENQIAIKTSEINELKNVDLLSKKCPIRFVITVNALKEGWDCPFAYILASVANKSSVVDVTQIVGRVLRQPYARSHISPLLNTSFVFTSSEKFNETLNAVATGLNMAGFSDKDYRIADETTGLPENIAEEKQKSLDFGAAENNWHLPDDFSLMPTENNTAEQVEPIDNIDEIEININHFDGGFENNPVAQNVADLMKQSLQNSESYNEIAQTQKDSVPVDLQGKTNITKMRAEFVEEMKDFRLPQFFIKVGNLSLFGVENDLVLLNRDNLLRHFQLGKADCNIDFDNIDDTLYQGDIDKTTGKILFGTIKGKQKQQLVELFSNYSDKTQQKTLVHNLFHCGKNLFRPISDDDVQKYLRRIVENMNSEQRQHCFQHIYQYFEKIKEKIHTISNNHAEQEFVKLRNYNEIEIKHHFAFANAISPSEFSVPFEKSLYEKEGKMSEFERSILHKIVSHSGIDLRFWHRNLERKGFFINAFLNHYPDFILLTQKGSVILLETKGNQLDNSDSQAKIKAGSAWENAANRLNDGHEYRYFMVFEHEPKLPNSYTVSEMLQILQYL